MRLIIFFTLLLFAFQSQAQKKKAIGVKSLTTSQLTTVTAKMQKQIDSAFSYYNGDDFVFNPDTRTISIKRDTFLIKRGAYIMVEPQIAHANQFTPIDTALRDIPKAYNLSLPQKDQKDQDIADLKWQVKYFEELLDDRERIIDKLQKIIKDLQKQKN